MKDVKERVKEYQKRIEEAGKELQFSLYAVNAVNEAWEVVTIIKVLDLVPKDEVKKDDIIKVKETVWK